MFFGPFNIWLIIALLIGVGLFIIGMVAFVIYAASSAMDFIYEVGKKAKNRECYYDEKLFSAYPLSAPYWL